MRTGAPRRAHGRRIVTGSPAVSWQGAGRVAGPNGCIAASLPHTPRASARAPTPSAPAPAPASPAVLAPYHERSAGRASAESWPRVRAGMVVSWPASRHSAAQPPFTIQLGQLYCNTLQPLASQYCNTISSLASHLILQYNPQPSLLLLQYNLGSSPTQICIKIFSFFIIITFFFPAVGKITKNKKNHFFFFFHFHNTSNKFLKIYFSPFPSIFQFVKS